MAERGAGATWRARLPAAGREATEARRLPWVIRDAVDDINRAVGRPPWARLGGAPSGPAALRLAALKPR